jgi:cytochrome P450
MLARPTQHLTFSFGIHFCVGAALARIEGAIANRLPQLTGDLTQLRWRQDLSFRGLVELPLEFTRYTPTP